jgi:hypothetical protein
MLTAEQLRHNLALDMEIRASEYEYQLREIEARRKNEEFCRLYPDAPEEVKATFGMNMYGPKRVGGIRYVE